MDQSMTWIDLTSIVSDLVQFKVKAYCVASRSRREWINTIKSLTNELFSLLLSEL